MGRFSWRQGWRMVSVAAAFMAAAVAAQAQSASAGRIQGLARSSAADVPSYATAGSKSPSGKLKKDELAFPLDVLEKTPDGMLRINVAGKDHWVGAEDFKVDYAAAADCTVVATRIHTGSSRGANEGCAKKPK